MKNLENYGVLEMNAKEITNFEGGTNTYPGGCVYSGGGSQCENPNYSSSSYNDDDFSWNSVLEILIYAQEL